MRLGVQFQSEVPANSTRRWWTHSWPQDWRVVWMVVPTEPIQDAAPQLHWDAKVGRQSPELLKYFIDVTNVSNAPVKFEARYAIFD